MKLIAALALGFALVLGVAVVTLVVTPHQASAGSCDNKQLLNDALLPERGILILG